MRDQRLLIVTVLTPNFLATVLPVQSARVTEREEPLHTRAHVVRNRPSHVSRELLSDARSSSGTGHLTVMVEKPWSAQQACERVA